MRVLPVLYIQDICILFYGSSVSPGYMISYEAGVQVDPYFVVAMSA